MNHPAEAQRRAADPAISAWVAANAGSGKTRVLTERVARLLLDGARPERIICLTYTKAAAAEMQNRLFETLGGWAMMDDEPLRTALTALNGGPFEHAEEGRRPRTLADARRLFAMALETPGGLKIQTIHAFCDGLLRRFPLEAGAPPEFRVMDDREKTALTATLLDDMADDAAFLDLAAHISEAEVRSIADAAISKRHAFPADVNEGEICTAFGTPAPPDENSALLAVAREIDRTALSLMKTAWDGGSKKDQARYDLLADAAHVGVVAELEALIEGLLTNDFAPLKEQAFKDAKKSEPDWENLCAILTESALAGVEARAAARNATRSIRLARFGGALVQRYEAAKADAAILDFDDLVGKARDLLTRSDMAAWALYRLDGGVDHVLVDEAQDTSPAQWDVIRAITGEFTSGEGARDTRRTTFVVGDEKQSIYSFQGAAPGEFDAKRTLFAADWRAAGAEMREEALAASFRSAPLILEMVDNVFANERADGLTAAGGGLLHQAFHQTKAGRIEIWPLIEPLDKPETPDPWVPVDLPAPDSPRLRLCEMVATQIKFLLENDVPLPGRGRPVAAGDILILLQKRPGFLAPLVAELKKRGVPVAGADRLKLGTDLAVKDLLSLMRAVVTRTDDLSLAEALRSPLCQVSEEALFELAYTRGKGRPLSAALKEASKTYPRDAAMLDDLMGVADYLRPYEFLERVLSKHDGRRRLLTRLGHQVEDAIDELLAQAMLYEAQDAPSLSGFLAWMALSDEDVKRDQESARDEVRVMTCHGAKGLEAPVVILPDTLRKQGGSKGRIAVADIAGRPRALWRGDKKEDSALIASIRAAEAKAADAEHKRLLYVAMTRAEEWLIVAGASDGTKTDGKWWGLIEAGAAAMPFEEASPQDIAPDGARVLETGTVGRTDAPKTVADHKAPAAPWLFERAPTAERLRRRSASSLAPHDAPPDRAPERDMEADFALLPDVGAPLLRRDALIRGEAIHLALESGETEQAALQAIIDIAASDLPDMVRAAAAAEAFAARHLPDAAPFFADNALAEAGVSLKGPRAHERVIGRIDRLVVADELVRFVDFKSDASPPTDAASAPLAYQAQMAAYRAALQAIYPARRVEACILWTAVPRLDRLDAAMLDRIWHAQT